MMIVWILAKLRRIETAERNRLLPLPVEEAVEALPTPEMSKQDQDAEEVRRAMDAFRRNDVAELQRMVEVNAARETICSTCQHDEPQYEWDSFEACCTGVPKRQNRIHERRPNGQNGGSSSLTAVRQKMKETPAARVLNSPTVFTPMMSSLSIPKQLPYQMPFIDSEEDEEEIDSVMPSDSVKSAPDQSGKLSPQMSNCVKGDRMNEVSRLHQLKEL